MVAARLHVTVTNASRMRVGGELARQYQEHHKRDGREADADDACLDQSLAAHEYLSSGKAWALF